MEISLQPPLFHFFTRPILMATDCTRTSIQNIQAGTFNLFFLPATVSLGERALMKVRIWTLLRKYGGSMKNFLREKYKPRNMGKLKEGIRTFWKQMTLKMCSRYINHLQKVMPDVIAANGAPSGHWTSYKLPVLYFCWSIDYLCMTFECLNKYCACL